MNLEQKIEAILFFKAEPIKISKLAQILEVTETEINQALELLKNSLTNRGLKIILNAEEVELVTAPEISSVIERLTKEELSKDLGRAGLETLSIVLYQGPIAKAMIDHIRGVNSSFILRNLQIRGLVEREVNQKDARSFSYKPTTELLAHLGITTIDELPEIDKVKAEINSILNNYETENDSTN